MGLEKKLGKDGMISNAFAFIFEKGEHKGELYNVFMTVACENPVCNCGRLTFFVKAGNDRQNGREYTFSIDVVKKKIGETSRKMNSPTNTNFAKSFIKELKEENWKQFYSFFYAYKSKLTENINNIDKLEIDFSLSKFDIEYNSAMTGYAEIFPFCKDFIIEYKNKKYLIDDQYCLSKSCNCKQTALTFIDFEKMKEKNRPNDYAIFYDYINTKWTSDVLSDITTPENKGIIDALKKQIPDINSTLKNRHKNLRRVYAHFNEKQENTIQKKINIINKVGRNDPCPCGSGKKYKKCCGR